MPFPDHYAVLGVRPDAGEEDIRAAWRRAARSLHPDSGGRQSDAAAFARASEAWSVLGDPERRRAYDESRRVRPRRVAAEPAEARVEVTLDEAWSEAPLERAAVLLGKCPSCLGRGRGEGRAGSWFRCTDCGGTGRLEAGSLNVRLPRGFASASLSTQAPGGTRVPLLVSVQLPEGLSIEGADVVRHLPSRPGPGLTETLPDRTRLSVRLPPGYDGRSFLRLAGRGLPKPGGGRGDWVLAPPKS